MALPVAYKDLSVTLSEINRTNMYIQPENIIFITKSDGLETKDVSKNIIFEDEDTMPL